MSSSYATVPQSAELGQHCSVVGKGDDGDESDANVVADGDCDVRRNMAGSYTVRRCSTDGAIT